MPAQALTPHFLSWLSDLSDEIKRNRLILLILTMDVLISTSSLKVKIAEAGIQIAEQAIQLHGAMGTTDELAVGYYYKRMLMIEQLYGNSNYHLDRFCRLDE